MIKLVRCFCFTFFSLSLATCQSAGGNDEQLLQWQPGQPYVPGMLPPTGQYSLGAGPQQPQVEYLPGLEYPQFQDQQQQPQFQDQG